MKIFVFGNPDLPEDSLPLRILPQLRKEFPEIIFEIKDPNEEWAIPSAQANGRPELVVIDTAVGIKKTTVFDDLKKFSPAPRVSMHDFDALTNLRYLQKLGKLKTIKVIGIPPDITEEEAVTSVSKILRNFKISR